MITDSFDNKSMAKINPKPKENRLKCDACIVTFSNIIENYVLKNYNVQQYSSYKMVTGTFPVYKINYNSKVFAFYKTFLGAPASVGILEDVTEVIDANKFIVFLFFFYVLKLLDLSINSNSRRFDEAYKFLALHFKIIVRCEADCLDFFTLVLNCCRKLVKLCLISLCSLYPVLSHNEIFVFYKLFFKLRFYFRKVKINAFRKRLQIGFY